VPAFEAACRPSTYTGTPPWSLASARSRTPAHATAWPCAAEEPHRALSLARRPVPSVALAQPCSSPMPWAAATCPLCSGYPSQAVALPLALAFIAPSCRLNATTPHRARVVSMPRRSSILAACTHAQHDGHLGLAAAARAHFVHPKLKPWMVHGPPQARRRAQAQAPNSARCRQPPCVMDWHMEALSLPYLSLDQEAIPGPDRLRRWSLRPCPIRPSGLSFQAQVPSNGGPAHVAPSAAFASAFRPY